MSEQNVYIVFHPHMISLLIDELCFLLCEFLRSNMSGLESLSLIKQVLSVNDGSCFPVCFVTQGTVTPAR